MSDLRNRVRTYTQSISVPFEHPVHFTRNVFDPENPVLVNTVNRYSEDKRHRVIIYVDSGLEEKYDSLIKKISLYFEHHKDRLELVKDPVVLPGGESIKDDMDNVWRIVRDIGETHLDRQSFVMAIGGGAILDMAGFATAISHRGLRYIRLPSTTLSQNDAGVGVKNGVNFLGQKNFVGTFSPAFAIINDYDFLETLPFEHWIGGISEAFKVAIIKDKNFFEFLLDNAKKLKNRDLDAMEEAIYRCAVLHLDHIRENGDPFEFGSARPLDFGHWSAHKLEVMSSYRIGHGMAVSIGISLDSYIAMRRGLISKNDLLLILRGFVNCGLPVWDDLLKARDKDGLPEIIIGLEQFREHLGGRLTITLPDGIGRKTEVHSLDYSHIEDAIDFLCKYSGGEENC